MKINKKRRREAKTDYAKRIKLLKSNLPRIVFRKTNKYLIAQYIVSKEARDEIKLGLTSKALLNVGWPEKCSGSLKSIPAAYLLGLLIGNTIKQEKLKNPIVDFGMIKIIHKTKTYAFLKGLKDSGLQIKCQEEFCPNADKLKGENLKNKIPFEEIKAKIIK